MLDCHDGIPVQPDLDGVLSAEEAMETVDRCLERGANLNRILSDSHLPHPGFDAHQINITYYSALGCDDDAYLAARAVQFFAPGIPQVYYVGLLAGRNDEEAVRATGEGRAVNRHDYSLDEIAAAARTEVVQRLLALIRFRNTHPAFAGDFTVADTGEGQLELSWRAGRDSCVLHVDLGTRRAWIVSLEDGKPARRIDI
jgi:sucrose phosphorylase